MSTHAPARLMTAEEFFDWSQRPENRDRHFELERGEVVEMSRPGERHGAVCANVAFLLGSYVRQRGCGFVCANDTGLILERDPDSVRGPDVALYADSRQFAQLNPRYSAAPPTLAVEVLSPNDRLAAVMRRLTQFLDWGIAMVWLVDPEDRIVVVQRPGQAPQFFESDAELQVDDLLPDFRCNVADFFWMPGESPAPAAPHR